MDNCATRVPPVAAMQAVATGDRPQAGRVRTVLGIAIAAGGVGVLGYALFGDAGLPIVIGGAVALLIGAALLARFVTRPLLVVIGWPVDRLGIRGTLVRENSIRNLQRTASTASALMIGPGLVTFALIFGASLRESTTATIDEQFVSDFQISSTDFAAFPSDVDTRISQLPEVASVTDMRLGQLGVDELTVTFPTDGELTVPVHAIVDSETSDFYLDERTYLSHASDRGVQTLYVSAAEGVDIEQARGAIEGVTDSYPALQVQDTAEIKEEIAGRVDRSSA